MSNPASDPTRRLTVTADDTTGALESAARAADEGWASVVEPHGRRARASVDDAGCVVIDLRSRHEPADAASARLAAVLTTHTGEARVRVHKIDSTLRGNWPAEVGAAVRSGRRVLLVPAYPSAGRVCRGGIVFEHGTPVDRTAHAHDVRSPVVTSRPGTVVGGDELADASAVERWLTGVGRVGIADATDDDELNAAVERALRLPDVLLVGTAGVVGAVARQLAASAPRRAPAATVALEPPVLIVCGSLHPASRRQVAALVERGAQRLERGGRMSTVSILETPSGREIDPATVAVGMASHAHEAVRSSAPRTVVLIGGDTAEAFIADRVVRVERSLATGVALGSIEVGGRQIALVTKPGAFGSSHTLVDLMQTALPGSPT